MYLPKIEIGGVRGNSYVKNNAGLSGSGSLKTLEPTAISLNNSANL